MEAQQDPPLPPEGRTPLDRLAPRDFFPDWPHGDPVPPADFEAYPFARSAQSAEWLRGVELFRDLVLDYRHYVATRKRQSVADATGISTNTLSTLNSGKRFPKVGTYLALRVALPEHTRTERERAKRNERRRTQADAEWATKEVQERVEAAVERRLEAELRRRRPER